MSKILEALNAEKKPLASSFEQWILTLDPEDQAALEAAALDPQLTNAAIMRVAAGAGYKANKETVSNWRAKRGFRR